MNFGSERIWHSQVHLPSVSAKYRSCQCAEIAGQHAVDRLKVGPPPEVDWSLGFREEVFAVSDRQRLKSSFCFDGQSRLVIPIQLAYREFSAVACHGDLG